MGPAKRARIISKDMRARPSSHVGSDGRTYTHEHGAPTSKCDPDPGRITINSKNKNSAKVKLRLGHMNEFRKSTVSFGRNLAGSTCILQVHYLTGRESGDSTVRGWA